MLVQEDLYSKICSLSYMGDLRMLFAEDKNKVKLLIAFDSADKLCNLCTWNFMIIADFINYF
jgi:hypothetical protein